MIIKPKKIFFKEKVNDEIKTALNPKLVQALKNLQVMYNEDSNKIVKQATQEKNAKENLKFLIDLPSSYCCGS